MNNFLNQTINNITIQREATLNNNLENAELQNEYVVNGELPEINTAFMNEVEINYIERGNDIQYLIDNFSDILAIAQQCPYYGGEAVYRARAVLELINDSLVYNDDANCLLYGIYRQGQTTTYNDLNIIVKPNPANSYVSIRVNCVDDTNFETEILNSVGQSVLRNILQCNKENIVKLNSLQQGIYTVVVKTTDKTEYFKLVIVR